MNSKQLSFLSLFVTIGFTIWTIFLPFWDSEKWFLDNRMQSMWLTFDVIFIIFMLTLTYFIWKEDIMAHFLAPLLFGMLLTDWILNISLWVIAGYNLLETRFILAFIFFEVLGVGYNARDYFI